MDHGGSMTPGAWQDKAEGSWRSVTLVIVIEEQGEAWLAAHVLRAQRGSGIWCHAWGARMSRVVVVPRGVDIKEVAGVQSAMQLRKFASRLPWWG